MPAPRAAASVLQRMICLRRERTISKSRMWVSRRAAGAAGDKPEADEPGIAGAGVAIAGARRPRFSGLGAPVSMLSAMVSARVSELVSAVVSAADGLIE